MTIIYTTCFKIFVHFASQCVYVFHTILRITAVISLKHLNRLFCAWHGMAWHGIVCVLCMIPNACSVDHILCLTPYNAHQITKSQFFDRL
jgi:hypothetical protein